MPIVLGEKLQELLSKGQQEAREEDAAEARREEGHQKSLAASFNLLSAIKEKFDALKEVDGSHFDYTVKEEGEKFVVETNIPIRTSVDSKKPDGKMTVKNSSWASGTVTADPYTLREHGTVKAAYYQGIQGDVSPAVDKIMETVVYYAGKRKIIVPPKP